MKNFIKTFAIYINSEYRQDAPDYIDLSDGKYRERLLMIGQTLRYIDKIESYQTVWFL